MKNPELKEVEKLVPVAQADLIQYLELMLMDAKDGSLRSVVVVEDRELGWKLSYTSIADPRRLVGCLMAMVMEMLL